MATKKPEPASVPATQNDMSIPEHLKKFVRQSEDTQSLATASMSVPRLSFRGKRFRFIENGEEELIKALEVDVIIVGVEPTSGHFIKTYYEKAYNPGDNEPPTCSSSDGIHPDSWVSSPQARMCSQCPKNIFGSATSRSGGKAKACKDGKRLWVVRPENLEKTYGLNVPVTSLKNLSEYGRFIGKHGVDPHFVITRLSLDEDAEFPELVFNHVGFVSEEASEITEQLNQSRPWKLMSAPLLDGPANEVKALPEPAVAPNTVAPSAPSASISDVVGSW